MNRRSYFFFFFSLIFILGTITIVGILSFQYVYRIGAKVIIDSRIDANKQEAVHVARLLSQKLKGGYSKQEVIDEFQKSIQYTPIDKGFECMFNQKGIQICHPDPQRIGKKIDSTNSVVSIMDNQQFKQNFENVLKSGKPVGGVRTFLKKNFSEIIYVAPVEGSNLVVAVHANLVYVQNRLNDFREKLMYVFLVSGLLISLILFVFIRFLYLTLEHRQNNRQKISDPKNVQSIPQMSSSDHEPAEKPNRILAHMGTKLVPVRINDIAYAYIDFKLTYIVKHSGEKFTINQSLDDLYGLMDSKIFFRANRQFIVSIGAVTKVEKYGNSQLSVKVHPETDKAIIISKLKMAAFKKWLGR